MPAKTERISTASLLVSEFGMTMTTDQVHAKFFPGLCKSTLQNKKSAGQLPPQRGQVFDTQDVAFWWDSCTPRR